MAEIEKVDVLENYRIYFRFIDGLEKTIDFKPYIKDNPITKPLAELDYFRQVKIYERGAGIYWPNGYDFDPTYLRDYVDGEVLDRIKHQHITLDSVDHIVTWSDWYSWTTFDVWQNRVPQTPGVYEAKFTHEMNRLTIVKADNLRRRINYLRTGTHSSGERIRQNHANDLNKVVIRWAETVNPLQVERSLKQNHLQDYESMPTYSRQ